MPQAHTLRRALNIKQLKEILARTEVRHKLLTFELGVVLVREIEIPKLFPLLVNPWRNHPSPPVLVKKSIDKDGKLKVVTGPKQNSCTFKSTWINGFVRTAVVWFIQLT